MGGGSPQGGSRHAGDHRPRALVGGGHAGDLGFFFVGGGSPQGGSRHAGDLGLLWEAAPLKGDQDMPATIEVN